MRKVIVSVFLFLLCASLAGAGNGKKILIYGPALAGPTFTENEKTIAEDLGYAVTVANGNTWQGMTTAQFASYNAIVFPDDGCVGDFTLFATANQNKSKWSPVITGPMVLYAADAVHHAEFGVGTATAKIQLIANALNYAASGPTTGLYASMSCYVSGNGQKVAYLSNIGRFELTSLDADDIHVQKPLSPLATGLTDTNLSNWDETSHSFFTRFPSYLKPIIIRRDLQNPPCRDCEAPQPSADGIINHYMMLAAPQRQ